MSVNCVNMFVLAVTVIASLHLDMAVVGEINEIFPHVSKEGCEWGADL